MAFYISIIGGGGLWMIEDRLCGWRMRVLHEDEGERTRVKED